MDKDFSVSPPFGFTLLNESETKSGNPVKSVTTNSDDQVDQVSRNDGREVLMPELHGEFCVYPRPEASLCDIVRDRAAKLEASRKQSEPDWDEIAEYAQGSSNSIYQIAATFELDDVQTDRIEEECRDRGHVLCEGCGWWVEDSELVEGRDGDVCFDCGEEGN